MGIAEEITQHFGENAEEGECSPPGKQDARPEYNGNGQFFLIVMQSRRNKTPGLVEQIGKADDKSDQYSELDIGQKSFRQVGINQSSDHRTGIEQRFDDKIGDFFRKDIGPD